MPQGSNYSSLTLSRVAFESVASVKAYGFHPPTLLLYARKQASPLGGLESVRALSGDHDGEKNA